MPVIILAFIAGVLTVLAPCILPILPIILGSSVDTLPSKRTGGRRQIFIIIISLAISIVVFSLLLKATTSLIGIPVVVWQIISGIIISLVGLSILVPRLWGKISAETGLFEASNKLLGKGFRHGGNGGAIITGFALGPVFNSCSPTYALIVAVILPSSFIEGLVYLVAYTTGLCLILLLIALLGQRIISKLSWLSNPKGWAHKTVGIIFIVIGVSILFGFDKKAQIFILEQGWYNPVSGIEEKFIR